MRPVYISHYKLVSWLCLPFVELFFLLQQQNFHWNIYKNLSIYSLLCNVVSWIANLLLKAIRTVTKPKLDFSTRQGYPAKDLSETLSLDTSLPSICDICDLTIQNGNLLTKYTIAIKQSCRIYKRCHGQWGMSNQ